MNIPGVAAALVVCYVAVLGALILSYIVLLSLVCHKTTRVLLYVIRDKMQYSNEERRMQELDRQVEQYEKIFRTLMSQFDWPMPIAKSVLMSGKHTDKAGRNFTLYQYKDENGEMCWALKPVEMRVK